MLIQLCTLLVLLLGTKDSLSASSAPPRIAEIIIKGNERSNEYIIRQELLFTTGELIDTTLFAESARNLRRLLYIGEVAISHVADRGETTVLVEVEDLYSRALSPLISGQIDELSIGLVGLDYNLWGRGQSTRIALEKRAISGYWADLYFAEPRLGGSRHALTTRFGNGSEGHAHSVELSRPFATLADDRAYGLSLTSQESLQRLYSQGRLTERYRDTLKSGRFWLVYSYGQQLKIRPSLQLNISQRRFAPSDRFSYAPTDRTRLIPSISLLIWQPHYTRARYIHDLGPLEDLQMGSWLSLRTGLVHKALGSDQTFTFYQLQLAPRFKPTPHSFAMMTLYITSRLDHRGYSNIAALASLSAYRRIRATHSLAMRISWEALHRSEDASQLLLGLERGLRGFAPRSYDGTRRLLVNLEARPTFSSNLWYVLAGAAFLDFGSAWTPKKEQPDLEFSPGLGIRLGLPKVYNTPVFRGDIAYGIGIGAWQLSLGLGQYF